MDCKHLIALLIFIVIYLCLGATIFYFIEAEAESDRYEKLRAYLHQFVANHSCLHHSRLLELVNTITGDGPLTSEILRNESTTATWNFSRSFSFAMTVITTIGYGDAVPQTELGKFVCICYAFIGIPITLVMLSGLGERLMVVSSKINHCQIFSRHHATNRVVNMAIIVVLGLCFLLLLPALVFSQTEGWNYIESLYYCFVTLSTIGFGDYIAGIEKKKLPSVELLKVYRLCINIWIFVGLAYISLIINYISKSFMKKAKNVERKTLRKIEAVSLHIQQNGTKNKQSAMKRTSQKQNSEQLSNATKNISLLNISQMENAGENLKSEHM